MNIKAKDNLELTKILSDVATYAVLEQTKEELTLTEPISDLQTAQISLDTTAECDRLLFRFGVGKIEYFPDLGDSLGRAGKGSSLSCGELLSVAALLRSARIFATGIASVSDPEIVHMRRLSDRVFYSDALEDDITRKIISETDVSDFASDKLFSLRKDIRLLNERIRNKLSDYLAGEFSGYLQDNIVTMRNDRYVLPVKAEYKRNVKGFVHDRSQSGATVFIEPEYILELNNELRSLTLDEQQEVERILAELSHSVGAVSEKLQADTELLSEADSYFARARYSYKNRCTKPVLNACGHIRISKGRHPLIDKDKVVPVSVELGKQNRFLLISGPNTGGKTVTMKMCGLFCLMAMCGLFVPCSEGSDISVFDEIFTDIGDAQSIEADLSTFSSHISNLISILNSANKNCLILVDELGGGTDPDEGQALAKAVIKQFLQKGAKGIITTHYSSLKEFAYATEGIVNACMEFDADSLRPLYKIRIGLPGSSNALAISRRLGLPEDVLEEAMRNLSEGAQAYENVVRKAEESRIAAEEILRNTADLEREWRQKVEEVTEEKAKLAKEREKLLFTAKTESKRIIADRTAKAEELLAEIEEVFQKESFTQADVTRARTLKNKIADIAYITEESDRAKPNYVAATEESLVGGASVYMESTGMSGTVVEYIPRKKEAVVRFGNLTMHCKVSDLKMIPSAPAPQKKKEQVTVTRKFNNAQAPIMEINVLGMTVMEALPEIDALIDSALSSGLPQVKIIHGMGTGKLREGIAAYLKKHPHVQEFRLGKYGEGETGVTFVKVK